MWVSWKTITFASCAYSSSSLFFRRKEQGLCWVSFLLFIKISSIMNLISSITSYITALRWKQIAQDVLKIARIAVKAMQQRSLTTNVAALTYTTVLSVVPLLALILALGRGFGLEQYIEMQLRSNLNVQENVIDQLMGFANSYIARTQDDMVIGVSFLFLLFTLISLVNNIEEKFNALWGVTTSRGLFAFSLSYLGLIVFLIFSIFLLSGVWLYVLKLFDYLPQYDLVQSSMPILLFILKWLLSSVVLGMMYKFIPVVNVYWRSIVVPAALAGFFFCLVQQFYIQGQMFLSSYNAVYGSFAVLPLLMVWVYATWIICLGGVILCQTIQTSSEDGALTAPRLSTCQHDAVALGLMRTIVRAFLKEAPAYTLTALASETRLPLSVVGSELRRLEEAGVLYVTTESETEPSRFKLDVDIYQLTVADLLRRLDHLGAKTDLPPLPEEWAALARFRTHLDYGEPGHLALKDLP